MTRRKEMFKKYVQYPLEWLAIQIVKGLFGLMPLRFASWLGGKCGEILGPTKRWMLIAKMNIGAALPECDTPEFYKKMMNNWGRVVAESFHLRTYARRAAELISIRNPELLKQAQSAPRLVLCHMHYGLMGLNALPFANDRVLNIVYQKPNNPLSDKLIQHIFGSAVRNSHFISSKDNRQMIQVILRGEKIAIAADLKYDDSIANFFGLPCETPTGALKLADKYELPIFMLAIRRTGGHRHEIIAEEIIWPEDKEKRNMQYINDVLERIIRRDPAQWLWTQPRWGRNLRSARIG